MASTTPAGASTAPSGHVSVSPGKSPASLGGSSKKRASLVTVGGAQDNVSHSYSQEEVQSVAEHVNDALSSDDVLSSTGRLPLQTDQELFFRGLSDGVVLCKLINVIVPDTIDERAVVTKKSLNKWELQENVNLCVQSAKAVGVKMINIGAEDIVEGKPHLVLSVLWQLIKMQLLARITLQEVPELALLLEEDEQISKFLKLPPETILLRWFNYHLKRAGTDRRVHNFSSDIKDSEAYLHLLHQLEPSCSTDALGSDDALARADSVMQNSRRLDADKYVTSKDIVKGVQQMNLAFVANLFNVRHGLVLEKDIQIDVAELIDDEDSADSREERVYKNWINSMSQSHCHNIVDDLQDGMILLETLDKMRPGSVDWKRVNKPPFKLPFKKMENTAYVVEAAKDMKLALVGIGGEDIVGGNHKLLLGLLWQFIRFDTMRLLSDLGGTGGAAAKDADVLKWANETVKASGSERAIASFKDKTMTDGLFFIDLLRAIEPRVINPELVMDPADNDKDKEMNAKYVISVARKLGCNIFLLWEHIVEVNPKMLLVMTAAIMTLAKKK